MYIQTLASVLLSDCCLFAFYRACVYQRRWSFLSSQLIVGRQMFLQMGLLTPQLTQGAPVPALHINETQLHTVTEGTVFCWKWSPCGRLGALHVFLVSTLLFYCKKHLNGWRRRCNGPEKVAAPLEPLVSS